MATQQSGYLGNPLLKKSGTHEEFTEEQISEYIKCSKDPTYFILNYVKIVNVDEGLVPFTMYDFQEKIIDTVHNNRFTIAKLPRQSGKTTTVVSYFLHYILFNEDVNIAILANKGSLARDILGRLQLAYENLPPFLQQGIKVWNRGDMQLENGSKIVAASTSSSAVRGGTYNMILLDEFAFVPKNIADEFFSSVYPTISSGKTTKVIIVSTPCGMNHFYKLWSDAQDQKNLYKPVEVHWSEVPGRDEQWKEETIRNTSKEQFAQEFECLSGETSIRLNTGEVTLKELYDELHSLPINENRRNEIRRHNERPKVQGADDGASQKQPIRRNVVQGDDSGRIERRTIHHGTRRTQNRRTQHVSWWTKQFDRWQREPLSTGIHNQGVQVLGKKQTENERQRNGKDSLEQGVFGIQTRVRPSGQDSFIQTHTERLRRNSSKIQIQAQDSGSGNHSEEWEEANIPTGIFKNNSRAIQGDPSHNLQHSISQYPALISSPPGLSIETPKGFEAFYGLNKIERDWFVHLILSDGTELKCSPRHGFFSWGKEKSAMHLIVGDKIDTKSGLLEIVYAEIVDGLIELYDAVNAGKDHTYYTNGVLSHNCDFVGSINTLINATKLKNMPFKDPKQILGDIDIYETPQEGHVYTLVVDVSHGEGLDYSAFSIIDSSEFPYKQVAKYRNATIPPMTYPTVVHNAALKYNEAFILVEINDIGQQVADILRYDLEYDNMLMVTQRGRAGQVLGGGFGIGQAQIGIKTTKKVKQVGCLNLKNLVESDKLLIEDFDTIAELTSFVARGYSYEAEPGHNDDLVMTLVLFCWLTTQPYFKDLTSVDARKRILADKSKVEEEELMPFGFIDSGPVVEEVAVDRGDDKWLWGDDFKKDSTPDPKFH